MVLQNNVTNLMHLVCFSLIPIALQVNLLFNVLLTKCVMATANTLLKSQMSQQLTKILESNVRVRIPSQYSEQELVEFAHIIPYAQSWC